MCSVPLKSLSGCFYTTYTPDLPSWVNLEKLPGDAGETIRIINIGDYDQCPCSGKHVSNTGEIGKFRIVSSDFNDGILRIRFKLSGTTYRE
ncbi:MAG: hypothetical protein K9J16_05760 [Melioribacteraceae bacterium]|nr:hypothetical protein [Melioribacteraceae bacterium]MCF8355251.1 hypothetical protein [Melioribacteraceae bacterium]MCF8394150.1 hypothetical protein [Melioribacteraceae bacterium]MCF8418833.1 hypothetical protein [Melioribacteraceae bacterium]